MGFFKKFPRLKDNDLSTNGYYYIPLESKYVKFELNAEEPDINGGKILGMRVWINLQSPVAEKEDRECILPIQKIKTPIVDTFEIPVEGYDILFEYLRKNEDQYKKHEYHITYSKLKSDMKETMDKSDSVSDSKKVLWTVGRIALFESMEKVNLLQREMEILQQIDQIDSRLAQFKNLNEEQKSQYPGAETQLKEEKSKLKLRLSSDYKKISSKTLDYVYNKISNSKKAFFEPKPNILTSLYDFSDVPFDLKVLESDKRNAIDLLLKDMYLEPEQEDFIRKYCHLERFKMGKMPKNNYSGIILYGPPGTGKTYTVKNALKPIFKELGFEWVEPKIGDLLGGESSGYVGGFAKPVNDFFMKALNSIRDNLKPAFIFIDEGTSLVEKPGKSRDNGSDWIGQGVETFKNFLNPELYPGIVLCISTNLESANFDPTIKDRRLKGVYVGLPNYQRAYDIWQKIIERIFGKKILKEIGETHLSALARVTENTLSVNTITTSCDVYKEFIDNENKDFNFEKFKEYFLREAEIRCKEEFDTSKSLLEGSLGAISYDPKLQEKLNHIESLYKIQVEKIRRVRDGISDEEAENLAVKRAFEIKSGSLETEYTQIYTICNKIYLCLEKNSANIGSVTFYDNLKILHGLIPIFLVSLEQLIKQNNSEIINLEISKQVIQLLNYFEQFYITNLEKDFLTPDEISNFILGFLSNILKIKSGELFNKNLNSSST